MTEKKLSEELRHCLDGNGCSKCSCFEQKSVLTCRGLLQKAYEVVKRHEEMEEQCNKENSWGLKMLLHKWKEFIEDIQELYEYRKLKEQGRLLKLPCAVGDSVYIIRKYSYCPTGICRKEKSCSECRKSAPYEVCERKFEIEDLINFGETVFLTKPEAEAKLVEMEGKK